MIIWKIVLRERTHVKLSIHCKPKWLYKPRKAWPAHDMRSNLALFGQFFSDASGSVEHKSI